MDKMARDRSSYRETYLLIGTCMASLIVLFGDAPYVPTATTLVGFSMLATVRIHERLRYPAMKRKGDA
jgi:hypothetical protein